MADSTYPLQAAAPKCTAAIVTALNVMDELERELADQRKNLELALLGEPASIKRLGHQRVSEVQCELAVVTKLFQEGI